MELCKVTEEDLMAAKDCQLLIIDGYHRYGSLTMIRDDPKRMLEKDIGIDWQHMAAKYPTWIKIDRWVEEHVL